MWVGSRGSDCPYALQQGKHSPPTPELVQSEHLLRFYNPSTTFFAGELSSNMPRARKLPPEPLVSEDVRRAKEQEKKEGKKEEKQNPKACKPFIDLQCNREGESSIQKNEVDKNAWSRTLALHLATTPQFIKHFVDHRSDCDQ